MGGFFLEGGEWDGLFFIFYFFLREGGDCGEFLFFHFFVINFCQFMVLTLFFFLGIKIS